MKNIKFDFSELKRVPSNIRKKVFGQWMERALLRYGLELEREIVAQIDKENLNYTGEMRKSVKSLVKKELNAFVLRVGTGIQRPFPYPVAVHEGTKPHWPPVAPIRKWTRLKLGIPKDEVNRVAYLISRKIARKGTKAKPFIRQVFKREKPKMATDISKHLAVAMAGGKLD